MADTTSPTVAQSAVSTRPYDWLRPRWFGLILASFIVLPFWSVFLGVKTWVYRDFGYFTYPVAFFQRECFWRGELPFWNPLNCFGIPFLAQWNTSALYPPSLIYLLLPLPWSLGFFQLLHLFIGGLGMYFLAHRWTNNRFAAAVAGVVFALSGLSLNCLMWVSNLAALMWMPWVIWRVECLWSDGGKNLAKAVIVGALQMLAGAPEIILMTWIIVSALAFIELLRGERARKTILLRTTAVVLLVAGLSAAQLLPFMQLLTHSHRDAGYSTSSWSMPVTGWANFFLPLFHAHPSFHGVFMQSGQGWTSSYYVGIATLALGIFAVVCSRHWRVWLLVFLALMFLLLALGDSGFIYSWLRQNIGALGFLRYPIKFVALPVFVFPLLAAFGISRLRSDAGDKLFLTSISALCFITLGALLWWEWRFPLPKDDWSATWRNALVRAALFSGIGALLFAVKRVRDLRTCIALQVLLVAFVWVDLMTHAPMQKSAETKIFAPRMEREFPPPQFGMGRAMVTPAAADELESSYLENPESDYISRRWALAWNCNLLDEIPVTGGFYSLRLAEEIQITSVLFHATNQLPEGLLDFAGVSMISGAKAFDWDKRTAAMPLLTGGQRVNFADAAETLSAMAEDRFKPREHIFLPTSARATVSATNSANVKFSSVTFSNQKIEARVEADAPAVVVVAQAFYPNWKAFVDGEPVPLLRANHAFQALQIPAGNHRIKIVYEDKPFFVGAALGLISLAICFALWWKSRHLPNG